MCLVGKMSFNNPVSLPILVLILISLVCFVTNKDTFDSCNRYTSFGYGYRDFFEIQGGNFAPNQVFYLEFYVKTASDAHILLKNDVTGNEGFEIVIGGGSNTFSQIRLLEKDVKNPMITQKTDNFLSGTDYKQFWISMDRLGVISVGKKEDDEVFLNWRFDNPFPIKYFSFASWTNTKADWRFGCKKQNDSDIIEESGNLTPLQKLKRDLFTFYDPSALPIQKPSTLEVKINFYINNVELNEKRGELSLHGYGDLKWQDGKIKWKPENYNGIENIYVPPFLIWTPNIRVYNTLAIDKTPLFDLTAAGVTAKYDGSIFWRPPFKSISSCTVDLKFWPSDVHNCSVYFGFWMEPSNLILTLMDEYKTLVNDKAGSKWEILEVIPYNSDIKDDDNYGLLYIELRRMQGSQTLLFIPYVAAVLMSLLSFWVSPNSSFKLHLSCGSLIIMLTILFVMGQSVPAMTENVPRIVLLYSSCAVATCIPIILFVSLKNIQKFIRMPDSMSKILNHNFLNMVCCLPELPENLTEYANLNDEENKLSKDRLNSLRFVIIVDRIFFVIYLIILVILYILI